MNLEYYILNKPYGYLSQFTDEAGHPGLNRIVDVQRNVYAVGRLDHDSEGLLLLSNDKYLNKNLLDPGQQHERTYYVLVDGEVHDQTLMILSGGVEIRVNSQSYITRRAYVKRISDPGLPERPVPIRKRKNIPVTWLEIKLIEGKNRQVRKMTAAAGHPTLRLVRMAIEDLTLHGLRPGELLKLDRDFIYEKLKL